MVSRKFKKLLLNLNKNTNMNTDRIYQELLGIILSEGDRIITRNHAAYSYIGGLQAYFESAPLVTVRRTAWKKALLEMEWFLSRNNKCPEQLQDWWKGQLNPEGRYARGYGDQLTDFTSVREGKVTGFNQIEWLINAIKHSPNSRRLIITTWHPEEMSRITEINENPNVPTSCHLSMNQYFVRNNKLHVISYQRSADMLLGTQHNWFQHWALLTWLAYKTGYEVGGMTWNFGDAHIYDEKSHIQAANEIINYDVSNRNDKINLMYTPTSDNFKASDFTIANEMISAPVIKIKPTLL